MANGQTISKINGYTIKDGVLRESFNGALGTIEQNFDALEDAINDINDEIDTFNKKTFYWANISVSGSSSTTTSPTFKYVYPSANNSGGLGTNSLKWGSIYGNNIYGTTIYENGTSLANKYGVTVTPTETSGTKIADIKVGTTTKSLYVPATASDNYLPLTGGTMTGDIYLQTNGGETDRKIGTEKTSDGYQQAYINFEGSYGVIDILGHEQVKLDGGQRTITLNSNGAEIDSNIINIVGGEGDNVITLDTSGIKLNTTASGDSIALYAGDGIYMDSGYNGALEFTDEGLVVRDGKGIISYGDIDFSFFDDDTSATEHRIHSQNSYIEFCDDDAEFNIGSPSLINIETKAIALRGNTEITAGNTLTLDGNTNANAANIKFGTVNSKTPYFGYAKNQTDGTFVWSITGTNYETGLAIGGGSGNLLWKGAKVATVSDIPSVGNGTLTIQKNGTKVQTFSASQSGNVTANITVPTKVSELTNDSSYATTSSVNTALSNAKSYTDTKVANLVGSAPDTLDTLEELADALKDNKDIVTVLENSIASKADKTSLDSYVTLSTAQSISGAKTFNGTHSFTGETKFTNSSYCPTFSDIANGIGKSSCFTRGAHMQVITGQILAPTAGYTDATRGYETEKDIIKFQRIRSYADGQPTVSDMATLSQGAFIVHDGVIKSTNGDTSIWISAQSGIHLETDGKDYELHLPTKYGTLATTDDIKTYSFSASNPTLAWGTTSTIGTAGGTTYKVTMPANPNTDTGATSVAVSGSGNAVTAASYDASTRKLTLTKGTTFLTSHQSLANYVTLNTTQTITGSKTFSAPTNVSGSEQVTTWFNTANGGRVGFGKEKNNSGTGIFFDQVSGTRRLNFRASSTAGAMVWEQPESGSSLFYDVSKINFRESTTIQFQQFTNAGYLYTDSSGYLKKGTMPTKLSAFTNDSGFTTNKGTVTSVTINGTNVTPDSNGLVNLGTISGGSGTVSGDYVTHQTQTATVLGTSKTTEAIGAYQLVFPNGGIFSGTAQSAGLVTRGICGVTSPDGNGSCEKENLFINFDGNSTYQSNRQLVLQAGSVGTHYGNNLYQYCAARGDAVKGYVDANAIKSLSISGRTITYTKGDGTSGTLTTQDTNTTYSAATSSALGLVKTGSNITNSSGTISITKSNVTSALGYTPMNSSVVNFEMNNSGSLKSYGGFIDFHFHDSDGKPTNASGTVVDTTPDYTSRIIENAAGQIDINGVKFKSSTVTGSLSGNASTATKLATARTLSFTNDATGSMTFDGSANASAMLTLKNSGVTAGSYGPSANASPAHGGTFSVPYITVDAKGRVTSASTKTITVPSVGTVGEATNATYAKRVLLNTTGSSTTYALAMVSNNSSDTNSLVYRNVGKVAWDGSSLIAPIASTSTSGSLSGNSSTTATTSSSLGSTTYARVVTAYAYESTKGTAGNLEILIAGSTRARMSGEAAYHGQQYLCCTAIVPKGQSVAIKYSATQTVYYYIAYIGG